MLDQLQSLERRRLSVPSPRVWMCRSPMIAGHREEHLTATFQISYATSLSHNLLCATISRVQQSPRNIEDVGMYGRSRHRSEVSELAARVSFPGSQQAFRFSFSRPPPRGGWHLKVLWSMIRRPSPAILSETLLTCVAADRQW
jgi:hypothetical protein